ncbi:MAG: hypothetical protein V4632_01155 [Pseudomonadota bacterium]
MRSRHLLMAIGLVAAGWLAFFGNNTPDDGIAEPVMRTSAPTSRPAAAEKTKPEPTILALRPRGTLISEPARTDALFANHSWAPPPPPPPPPPKPVPPPPPSAPPLPFTYLGKKIEDQQWEAYLARGEQTFIVRDQTVIDGTYRVDSIKPPILSLTYLPLNQVQTLTIGGTE